jgi:hypothetical protein
MVRLHDRRCRILLGVPVVAQLLAAAWSCRGTKPDGPPAAVEAERFSPPPRAIRVEKETVVIEGRWAPIDPGGAAPPPNAVRVVCRRADRTCREELTTAAPAGTPEPARERAEYEAREWTPAKLVAVRRTQAGDEVELFISLVGNAATKSVTRKRGRDAEVRWRLE